MADVGMRFGKILLSHFCKENFDIKTGLGTETRIKLLHSIEVLTQPLQHTASQGTLHFGVRKSDLDEKTIHFGRKFGRDHMLASALGYIAEHCLEKDKRYEASCIIFTQILMKRSIKAPKRGKWWVRLATDLKHLRLKKDVARVIECALRDV